MKKNFGEIYFIIREYIKNKEVHTPTGIKAAMEIEIMKYGLNVTKNQFDEVYEDLVKRI